MRRRALYLWVLFSIPAVSAFGHYLAPNKPFFKGHDLGILAGLTLVVVAAMLWIPFQRKGRWPLPALIFLGLLAAAWLYQIVRIQFDGTLFNITAFAVPVALLAIAIKPTSRSDLYRAALVLGYSMAVVSFLAFFLGQIGLTPSGFEVSDATAERTGILSSLGIDKRWGGPFGSVNYASPVGGLLVVLGATFHGRNRWVLIASGVFVLALGQGRATVLGLILAGLVFMLFSERFNRLPYKIPLRAAIAVVVLAGLIVYIIQIDPTFNGRTPIWLNFYELFVTNPMVGVGETGVLEFVARTTGEPGFVPHTHGHSVLVDGSTRFGLIFTILTLSIYGLSLTLAMRARTSLGPGPLSITVFVIAAGFTETIYSWNYWSVYTTSLVFVALVSSAQSIQGRKAKRLEDSPLSFSSASNADSSTRK